MTAEGCDHKDGKKKVNYTNSREFEKSKELKAVYACLLIKNIFKEKVMLQKIKFWQWKAGFFQACFSSYSSYTTSYDKKVLGDWH